MSSGARSTATEIKLLAPGDLFTKQRISRLAGREAYVYGADAPRVVVILPGAAEGIEGWASFPERYPAFAAHLAEARVAAVVYAPGLWDTALENVLDAIRDHAVSICGHADPEICLAGHSAGAATAAAVATGGGRWRRPGQAGGVEDVAPAARRQITRLLLLSPTHNLDMKGFSGELYVVIGAHDRCGLDGARDTYRSATTASRRELVVVPEEDHGWRGPFGDEVFALRAPLFAFDGGPRPPEIADLELAMRVNAGFRRHHQWGWAADTAQRPPQALSPRGTPQPGSGARPAAPAGGASPPRPRRAEAPDQLIDALTGSARARGWHRDRRRSGGHDGGGKGL